MAKFGSGGVDGSPASGRGATIGDAGLRDFGVGVEDRGLVP